MTLLIVLIVLAFAAGLFDAWTTNDCIRVGLIETGILTSRIIGQKPSSLKVYLFNWATFSIFTFISLYAFPLIGMWALAPSIYQIAGHTWAGYHNMGQYTSWMTKK